MRMFGDRRLSRLRKFRGKANANLFLVIYLRTKQYPNRIKANENKSESL